jgi:hypothetical protein
MPVQNSVGLIAYCGLYCGACGSYIKGKCPGCAQNTKASWCKVRQCCIDNKYSSCADCAGFEDKLACGKLNNFVSRLIGFFTGSDRIKCIKMISELGPKAYAEFMSSNGFQSITKH